jgi:hypothetical protein
LDHFQVERCDNQLSLGLQRTHAEGA